MQGVDLVKEQIFRNAVKIAHNIAFQKVQEGDIAVDATVGNGNDTVLLAKLVGKTGKVYGFDIQDIAIKNTEEKLLSLGVLDRVKLIKDNHDKLDMFIKEKIDFVMFNLGYLPGGDHSIITTPQSTIKAVEKAISKLNSKGMIILVVYTGHEGGKEEKDSIERYVRELDQKKYTVLKYSFLNQINNPPMIIAIEKKQ
jgi:predicted methyltransferase